MWLDRLAGQPPGSASSSQPGSRAYSPAPGRRTPSGLTPYTTSQQRPGITSRTSSLSLASNDSSTSSLLASSRRANGSSLKQTTTAYTGPEPVLVLNKILGEDIPETNNINDENNTTITPDDLELDFDFGGLSLSELALSDDQIEKSVAVHGSQTVEECMTDPNPQVFVCSRRLTQL